KFEVRSNKSGRFRPDGLPPLLTSYFVLAAYIGRRPTGGLFFCKRIHRRFRLSVTMGTLFGEIRYALRQFWVARVFTSTAILTLALGIGGTTAIFTLMHAVMVRSLPVGDPERLYRVGDGDSCCVQGGPQNRWGMFSYPLFERLKTEMPEFEEVTAFQAGLWRVSVRRQDVDVAARPLRSEYVGGNYFTTLGVNAFGGRVFTAADDTPAAAPVLVLSHHSWQGIYGGDPKIIGATLFVEGRPFTVAGVTPPGFFGETLRGDPPD